MKFFGSNIILASLILCFSSVNGQSSDLTQDELARLSFSVHLLTYDTVSAFESSLGEAYFQTMIHGYENGVKATLDLTGITPKDKRKIADYQARLEALRANIPTWNQLLKLEDAYQKYLDRSQSKQSKYKQ